LAKGYARKYSVDLLCAIAELRLLGSGRKRITVKTEELRKKGFKKDFCTSVYDHHRGKIWTYCIDLC